MKKLFKKLAVLVSAAVLLLAVTLASACGSNENQSSFSITVLKPDGTAAANVMVSVCTKDETYCSSPRPTDAEGKLTYPDAALEDQALEDVDYIVKILSSPVGVNCYIYSDNLNGKHENAVFDVSLKDNEITITLVAKPAA